MTMEDVWLETIHESERFAGYVCFSADSAGGTLQLGGPGAFSTTSYLFFIRRFFRCGASQRYRNGNSAGYA